MKISKVKLGKRIKKIRKSLGLSQESLSKKINLKRSTISQIENGNRKISAEELVIFANFFNISPNDLLNFEKKIEVDIKTESKNVRAEDKEKIRINVPQKNLNKFREVLLYILNKVGSKANIGETVIYKLLYFIDFDFYEKFEKQLIGATYIKNNYGPTPVEFKKIVEKMITDGEIEKVKSKYFDYPQTKYLPRRKPNLELLNGNELELINDVLEKLSDKNAAEISEYSHQDVPWITAEKGKPLEYESVFYRTNPYSVRSYDEDRETL